MKQIFSNKMVLMAAILVGILAIVIFVIISIGKAYKSGLNINPGQNSNYSSSTNQAHKIKKITLKKSQDKSCIEVTPDGAVRVYSDCDKKLTEAGRVTNQSNISDLFKLINENDFTKYLKKNHSDDYELTIDTGNGIVTIYLPSDPGGIGEQIINIIDDLPNNIHNPSPFASWLPTPNSSSIIYVSPNTSTEPFNSPVPGSSDMPAIKPFVCQFTESGGKKKPFNVSNIICSTDPSPAP